MIKFYFIFYQRVSDEESFGFEEDDMGESDDIGGLDAGPPIFESTSVPKSVKSNDLPKKVSYSNNAETDFGKLPSSKRISNTGLNNKVSVEEEESEDIIYR